MLGVVRDTGPLSPPQAGDLIVAQGEPVWPAKPLAKQAGEPWVSGLDDFEPAGGG